MFGEEPPIAPPPPPPQRAPSPPVAPSPAIGRSPRYVYLLSRLRSRQITMEEAMELFSAQQSMIRDSSAQVVSMARGAGPAALTPRATPPAGPSQVLGLDGDSLALGLLLLGAGTGLLAALVKRLNQGSSAPRVPAQSISK